MDVMLGDPKLKRQVLAQGPRRERPDWLKKKNTAGVSLPPLRQPEIGEEKEVMAEISLDLPSVKDVWSIVEHRVSRGSGL